MFNRHKPDPAVVAAFAAAIRSVQGLPKLSRLLTDFASQYQAGKASRMAIGVFSSRVAHVIFVHDYQMPTELLALLSVLNQTPAATGPLWSGL